MLTPDDFDRIKGSRLVSRIVSEYYREDSGGIRHKIRVELLNGWHLECWEHIAPGHRRYSFHVFQNSRVITRWDNSPRHRQVSTFPYHQHLGDQEVVDSENMDVGKVLAYLERIL